MSLESEAVTACNLERLRSTNEAVTVDSLTTPPIVR